MLNFSDNSYFARFFRKNSGLTPEEFRPGRRKIVFPWAAQVFVLVNKEQSPKISVSSSRHLAGVALIGIYTAG